MLEVRASGKEERVTQVLRGAKILLFIFETSKTRSANNGDAPNGVLRGVISGEETPARFWNSM